jgi:predicted enzyme related to lactoylglutathione lyase
MLNWLEIPASDFDRAVRFYGAVLGRPVPVGEFMGVPHGFLQDAHGESGGAVIPGEPANGGPLIYLNAAPDLDAAVSRVESAGGRVVQPATSIGQQGAIAIIVDTEGNRVGLHAA